MMLQIVYFIVFAGLSWLCLRLRQPAAERGWGEVYFWLTNSAWAAGVISVFSLLDKKPSEPLAPVAGWIVLTIIISFVRNWLSKDDNSDSHIRGARLVSTKAAARSLHGVESRFEVGGTPVPRNLETRGFLLAGSPGTGKSQTLTSALDALHADGARAVVADASGIYTARFYQDGRDIIVNPFDARCARWSPLAELESEADIPALSLSLIPEPEGAESKTWAGYSRTLLEAILEHCFANSLTNGDIYHLSILAEPKELMPVFAGTPAQSFLGDGNERMFANARSGLADSMKVFRHLDPTAGTDGFSIRKHIVTEQAGWIFLSYQQQHRDALKSMIAACIDIAGRAVLSLPPDLERRVIFSLDEMPLLGQVNSIVDLATNGRRHGAMLLAGLQTIAQLRESYGRDTSQTLLACLGSWLVLRVADAETADYMSRYLGEEEKTRIVHGGGESSQGSNSGWQQQIVKDRVVLPSELQSLPDLLGIFNLAGPTPSAWVRLSVAEQRQVAEAYQPAQPRARKVAQPGQTETPDQSIDVADLI